LVFGFIGLKIEGNAFQRVADGLSVLLLAGQRWTELMFS
jgi:hypothetical protein